MGSWRDSQWLNPEKEAAYSAVEQQQAGAGLCVIPITLCNSGIRLRSRKKFIGGAADLVP
ncbi:hypothetical protein KAM344_14880 [Aeromonas caviae]|uniref:Uncharacterized protein n=1 Tax=Aeromonas caviae TaxID=648 RepID=A0AAV4YL42_AERCA|nr:hypothetical protein KAM342_16290 [Aeromonas caviae]GJA40922.1 hypothetical protein KAM343_17180 [Aeromonas caviae]GJB03296.1 hypothetical protein KAM360_22390 [Aeromonas caviae]GKQ66323.1 hypothetical protein KAM344_14880 [Aeromonas caviae]GKR69868.1 hypothetical protein KAM479_17890 [Aeromonas caviae]